MTQVDAIALIVFLVVSFGATAIGLLIRELVGGTTRSDSTSPTVSLRRVPAFVTTNQPTGISDRLDKALYLLAHESGLQWSVWSILLLMIVFAIAAGGLVLLVTNDTFGAAFAAMVALWIPVPFFAFHRSRRINRMRQQLPDAIDLLARAVSAGESLEQGVQLVGDKSAAPLSTEFKECSKQLDLGLSIPAAVRAMSKRVPLTEMKILSATLSVYRQTGGSLATTLSRLATVFRERLTYQRQLRATTAAGRFSAMVVATVGPLLFIYLMLFQPEYFNKLLTIRLGQYLLGIAFFLEVIGITWVMSLLRSRL